jgi:hypothetical protein
MDDYQIVLLNANFGTTWITISLKIETHCAKLVL